MILCSKQRNNIFDRADAQLNTYSNQVNQIEFEFIEEINSFTDEDNNILEFSPTYGTINYAKSMIYIYDRFDLAFYVFDLDNFSDKSTPKKIIRKMKGKGPGELQWVKDFKYHNAENVFYISDLHNYSIYVYDLDFNEISRHKVDYRPFKISICKDGILVNSYDGMPTADFSIERISETGRKGIFTTSDLYKDFIESSHANKIFANEISDSLFVVGRTYPNFNLYICSANEVYKKFTSPEQLKTGTFPRPKIVQKDGERYQSALVAYQDIFFSEKTKRIITLSTGGDQAKKMNVDRYITIYDLSGNTIGQLKLDLGGEDSILIDERNNIIYYFSRNKIAKYKMIEKEN
jgi:hypothetical protein